MLSPPSAKKLSSIPTRASPNTSANSAHRISSCGVRGTSPHRPRYVRRRQRATVQLAVGRQRKTIQHHDRRRHHVLRQPRPKMRTQRRRIRPPQPRRRNHIANQLPAARAVLARNHRSLRNAPLPNQRRLDLPRLNPETRAPSTCASARPRNSSTPSTRQRAKSPVRYIRPPHHQTGPQQTAPPSAHHDPHSPAQGQLPQCKAPQLTPAGTGSKPPSKT